MKKLISILLFSMLSLVVFCQAVPADTAPGDTLLINNLFDAVKQIFSYVNWVFLIIFIVVTWLINDVTDAENCAQWLTWFSKIPKVIRVLIFGVLQIMFFAWAFEATARIELFKLMLSLLFSMVVYKIGINKFLKAISTRLFGLKFE